MKTILEGSNFIKLLLDQGLPRSLASLLRDSGVDAMHVGEQQLSEAADTVILDYARETDRTVITHDADFHTLIALSNATKPSVIRIRIEGLKAPQLFSLIELILDSYQQEIGKGALVSVNEDRVRLRSLPIY
jgi:predicted nuclease of predicted toxin-antitoxin system